jgi:MFS family permease
MTVSTPGSTASHAHQGRRISMLWDRKLGAYPDNTVRVTQLVIVVLVTVALYYENYVTGSVSTLQLTALHMSFIFYVTSLAVANLLGAFGSLVAGLSDRLGRANLVVGGLLVAGIMTAFVTPAMTSKWPFIVTTFVVGIVEGIVLVATPALMRDFSPQVGRATAMGFWTMGPVLGSLVVSIVGTNTIHATTTWPHEYRICGLAGLAVFVIALIGLRELSPSLRDQLMVSTKDRALIEARAKGLDIEATLRHPWRQMLKADIVISAIGISVILLAYYTAVAFGTILFTTIFGFSLKDANGLGNWAWGADAIGLLVIGIASDRLRVRKPFMVVGGIGAAVTVVVFLSRFGHHTSYYTVALIVAILSVFLAFSYAPWMASFTESVEARNPALTGTGLAVWGWIIRVVIFASFMILPHVVDTVTPLVTYGPTVQADAARYKSQIAFAQDHPQLLAFAETHGSLIRFAQTHASLIAFAETHTALIAFTQTHASVIATATKDATQLADAQRFAPELAVIEANRALFAQLNTYPNPGDIPPAVLQDAITAAGGGSQGLAVLETIEANKAAISGVIAVAPQLQSLTPYAAQLRQVAANAAELTQLQANATEFAALQANAAELGQVQANAVPLAAVSKAAPALTYLGAHATAVKSAAARSPGQWRDWYWVCFGGCIFFLGCIPLLRGRWSPGRARADEAAHEAKVLEEIAKLNVG